MGFKLGDISPLAGLVTGKGLTTSFGLIPALLARKQEEEEEKKKAMASMAGEGRMQQGDASGVSSSTGMKKGGKVSSASKRADGCAQRGKTKGRIV